MLGLSLNKRSAQSSIVSCKGILLKSDSTLKLAITKLESKFESSATNENKSFIVHPFKVKGASNGTKHSDSLYVGVPIAGRIGRKDGTPSLIGL